MTISYKFAKIYLHKGTADRRLVQIISCKIAAKFSRLLGGYFCVLLLSLLPIAYPSPKAVRHKLMTAIRPSIVNIGKALLSQIPARRFLCNRRGTPRPVDAGFAPTETKCRTQSLRIFAERLAAYRYGSTRIIFYQKMLSATRDIQAFSGCFTIVSQRGGGGHTYVAHNNYYLPHSLTISRNLSWILLSSSNSGWKDRPNCFPYFTATIFPSTAASTSTPFPTVSI